jgi:hypothetical protein
MLLLCSISGCAKYEFNLVQPADRSQHIGAKTDAVVAIDPLEYRLRAVDGRLVMRIFNPTEDPIELIGPKCTVVDPKGQSHPLRSETMAGGSFIKLIFPPMRPRVYQPYYGPTIGVGVGYSARGACRPFRYQPMPSTPRYFTVYDESDTYYWDWKGEGEVRIALVFRRGDKEFRHEFLFRRVKM